jgi:uncharacterized damage-inducible protein DinB
MSVAVPLLRLLDYSDYERAKWKAWIADNSGRLSLAFQPTGRFPTVWTVFDHLFLIERRHLSRLQGATPPDVTGVAVGDWQALLDYGDLVRADLRRYLTDLTEADAASQITFTVQSGAFTTQSGTFTVTRGKLAIHILMHEIRHLAQIAYAARAAGQEPPGLHDYFYFPET